MIDSLLRAIAHLILKDFGGHGGGTAARIMDGGVDVISPEGRFRVEVRRV